MAAVDGDRLVLLLNLKYVESLKSEKKRTKSGTHKTTFDSGYGCERASKVQSGHQHDQRGATSAQQRQTDTVNPSEQLENVYITQWGGRKRGPVIACVNV